MKSLKGFFARLGNLTTRRAQERRLREEIEEHIALQTAENLKAGLSPVEARRQAMVKFGGVEGMKEEFRAVRGLVWIENLLQDVRYAIRSLRRTPGLTIFVVITLALGIGMTAATFSMVDGLIFRPYPVPHPGSVVTLVGTTHDSNFDDFSYREYLDIRDKTKSYDGVIANADMQAVGFSAEPGATPRIKGGMMVSGNYFRVLGVEPRLGRGFREDEDRVPGRDAVVVLGPDFWKREFASDPSILGRTIRLNGTPFTVIGVAPETFPGMLTFGHPDFYMPLAMAGVFSTNLQKNFFEDRDDRELNVKARLKPGITLLQARNELEVLAKNFERDYPQANHSRGAMVYTQFQAKTVEDTNWKFGVIFVILALAVLLVACTNVAGLLLSRARARTREVAVRLALGAGRFRLIRLLLTESLILATLAGVAGIIIGYWEIEWFHTKESIVFMTELPLSIPFHMDETRAAGKPGAGPVERAPLRPRPGAAKHSRGFGERTQVGRRGCARAQATLGPQCARGRASIHVPDAADRIIPDGSKLPAQLARRYRIRERTSPDGRLRSASGAVQRHSDKAILQIADRADARDAGSEGRDSHAKRSAGTRRFRRRRVRAGWFADAAGSRKFYRDDGYGR